MFIVDFQGFKDNTNKFVIKEFAICSLNGESIRHWIVKPPYEFSELNQTSQINCHWLKKYYHGLSWEGGDITMEELLRNLSQYRGVFFVKGIEKKNYLNKFFSVVENLEDFGCPRLNVLDHTRMHCFEHSRFNICSLNNAMNLSIWAKENLSKYIA